MGRKMSFFDFWKSMKERGALLERASQLRLLPSQLKHLHGDSGVRVALRETTIPSLLPPVGTAVFRRFTPDSPGEIKQRLEAEVQQVKKHEPYPAGVLEAGKPLPFIYGVPPPELLNTPLEDLDTHGQSDKRFIVLGKGSTIHRFNAEPSCYLLSPFNPFRTIAIKILTHSLFNLFIMVTILTNCVFMMMSNPPAWSQTMEYAFMAVYTFEVIVKVGSRGLWLEKFTFLRDPWNWLDLMVIFTAYLAMCIPFGRFSVLSTIPRILKLLPLISGMKSTLRALAQSVKRLAGIIILTLFCLSLLAVIGLQVFIGGLRHKCVIMPSSPNLLSNVIPGYYDNAAESSFDFADYMNNSENFYFLPGQIDALLCGNSSSSGVCPDGFTCLKWGKNPNYGFTSYDSFGWSLLSMLRLMTRDFWDNLVMLTLRAEGKHYLAFFMLFVFPSTFFILSLILVGVAMAFGEQEEARAAEAKQKEEEFSQIVEAVKRREEEEQTTELSEKKDGEDKSHEEAESGEQRSCPPCCFTLANLLLKWDCCSSWKWLKQQLYTFITNPFFDFGIFLCLIVNIVFMAMEHYPMSGGFEKHLRIAETVFTMIFAAEMVIKVVAMDPYNYFQVSWNIFDSVIVFISLLELAVQDVSGLSLLRNVRLLRVFRLARWWPSFQMLLKIISSSGQKLRNSTLLLLIMVFLFAVVGMQLFDKDYKDHVCHISSDCTLPRWHMVDFFHSFLLIVRVHCGQWVETLWDCMAVAGQPMCLIFFITILVIGNLLVLNLFLALLLSSFISHSLVAVEDTRKNNVYIAMGWIRKQIRTFLGKKKHVHKESNGKEDKNQESLALRVPSHEENNDHTTVPIAMPEMDLKMPEDEEEIKKHPELQQVEDGKDREGVSPEDCCVKQCYRCCPLLDIDTSRGVGRVWSNVRKASLMIVKHRGFDIFIFFVILLSTVALMFEDIHLQNRPVLERAVKLVDQVCIYLFLLEMLLKWLAFGLKKYFTDAWCWLDFLVLDVFVASLIAHKMGYYELGAIQSLRALGPLRAMSRFGGVKVLVHYLFRTGPYIFDTLLVALTLWLTFSMIGVNMYAGKFYYCFNETSGELLLPGEVNNKSDCLSLVTENYTEIRWKNAKFNFDNVMNGYQSLQQMEASSDWFDIMYAAVDSTQVESQPGYERNIYSVLYFIFFFIIAFFTLNFFIRIIINHLQKDKVGGKPIFMTEEQQKCSKAIKKWILKNRTPAQRPQNQCQARLYDLVTSQVCEVIVLAVIFLNILALMLETEDMSAEKEEIMYWILFICIVIYVIELILKIIALRRHYFTDWLNVLDFIVVFLSFSGLFITDLMEKYFVTTSCFALFRLLCIFRVLRFCRCARAIRKLIVGFMMSLPALFNIGLLLFLIMVTFSLFGMYNFAYVKKDAAIDDLNNFETFLNSLSCMFMTTTSSGWTGLLWPITDTPPDCDPYEDNPGLMATGNCGNPLVGIIFFHTYIILYILLIVHLYIAVVLETFNSEDSEALCEEDLKMFHKTWRTFDADASHYIPYSELSDFCNALQDPLRIPKPSTVKLIHMDLPLFTGDKIHCLDVFNKLAAQVVKDPEDLDSLKGRMKEMFEMNSSKESDEPISSTLKRKQQEVAATVIQRAYRKGVLKAAEETALEFVDEGVPGSSHPADA
ncbi:sodium channel protein type 4 subunit alpha B-like [Brachionichthys hirsutus]|uniref:sodium channel protein type 4 subunit alpha B-like n=1 Tax=Brachionichthys hirsutus TaxID=412623 RepID=UPI0036052B03